MITDLDKYRKIYEEYKPNDLFICLDKLNNNSFLLDIKKQSTKYQRLFNFGEYKFINQIGSYDTDNIHKFNTDEITTEEFVGEELTKFTDKLYSFNKGDKYQTINNTYYICIDDKENWILLEDDLLDIVLELVDKKSRIDIVGKRKNVELLKTILDSFNIGNNILEEYVYDIKPDMVDTDTDKELDIYLDEVEDIKENKEVVEDVDDIPDDMTIDSVVGIFTDQDEVKDVLENYGKKFEVRKGDKMSPGLTHKYVKNNDILWIVVMLKPRSSSVARTKIGEMGVVKVRVMSTYYGLNKLKQLKDKDIIIR